MKANLNLRKNKSADVISIRGKRIMHSSVEKKILLPLSDGVEIVKLEDISYLKAMDHFSLVFLLNGRRIICSYSFKEMNEKVEGYGFYKVHKSTIINLSNATKLLTNGGCQVVMACDSVIDVARARKTDFKIALNDFFT